MLKHSKMLFSLVCIFLLLFAPLLVRLTNAREKCGGIDGRVTTQEGYIIPAADIRLVNTTTKQSKTVVTNAEGVYSVCLEKGIYDVFASSRGFKTAKRKSIVIDKLSKNIIDFVMQYEKPFVNPN